MHIAILLIAALALHFLLECLLGLLPGRRASRRLPPREFAFRLAPLALAGAGLPLAPAHPAQGAACLFLAASLLLLGRILRGPEISHGSFS
ncbi:hypothetical protein [Desulfohalovibrio reitneri]|uniref:hypothetical protein n=1 Tax=Desulfohalovibrio reitneri TaxID=1307759 RepID=UPI0004A6E48F|nr:hypothetical protein [Desulfohalovibrio reitneri]